MTACLIASVSPSSIVGPIRTPASSSAPSVTRRVCRPFLPDKKPFGREHLDSEGYRRIAAVVMEARERLVAGLARIEGLHLWGTPDLWAVAYGSEDVDIHAVADAMTTRRWSVGRVRTPPGIHLMLTPVHAPIVDAYLADLAGPVAAVRVGAGTASRTPVVY